MTIRDASKNRREILFYLKTFGPATDLEIQRALRMRGDTERPRRIELEAAGLVQESGWYRQTSSGRLAIVWEAT